MYRAIVILGETSISKFFYNIAAAENWLDSENNNLKRKTIIQELDKNYRVIDWFYYTE